MDRPASTAILTIPNLISFARLGTVPVFMWLFLNGRENAAVLVYIAGAWTDFFDGWIARRTNQVSELGKLLDPIADRVFIVALAVALVARETLPWWLALVILARDLLIVGFFPVLERRGVQRMDVNPMGKFATATLLVGLTWLALSETDLFVASAGRDVGLFFTIIGAVAYWVAAAQYATVARARLRELAGRAVGSP